jgi:hypothetical protein
MTAGVDERILRRLSPGDADPILVADFQAMSMAPRLSEMLGEHLAGRAVFQLDPIAVLSGTRRYRSMPELAAAGAEEFRAAGADHGDLLVVGHCSAAPLALRVAAELAGTRTATAVLVNPSWPDDEHVAAKFAEFLGKFGPAPHPVPELSGDPEEVVASLERVFQDKIAVLAASRGISGTAGAFTDLIVWYRAWLAFVLAGRNDPPLEPGRWPAVSVLSDAAATLAVPGLDRGAYPVQEIAPQPVGMVTAELAQIVAAHLAPR